MSKVSDEFKEKIETLIDHVSLIFPDENIIISISNGAGTCNFVFGNKRIIARNAIEVIRTVAPKARFFYLGESWISQFKNWWKNKGNYINTIEINFKEAVTITAALQYKINVLKKMLDDNPNQSEQHVNFTLEEIERLRLSKKKVGEHYGLGYE
jgi:hypothetical protein